MANEYSEKYRGFTIKRLDDGLVIYDSNGCYVKRMETLIIYSAKVRIDEILKNSRWKPAF